MWDPTLIKSFFLFKNVSSKFYIFKIIEFSKPYNYFSWKFKDTVGYAGWSG